MPRAFEIALRNDGRVTFALPDPSQPVARLVSLARDEPSGAALALVGRLDYVEEIPGLGRPIPPTDAAVALEVYRRRGVEGLGGLEGEYALVVHDPAEGRIIALRDHLGSWPLYHDTAADEVRVGTDLAALARRTGRGTVDMESVAGYVAHPFAFTELPTEATIYSGLRRVQAGTALALAPGRSPRVVSRWDLDARLRDLSGITLGEAAEEFAGLLRAAVAQRVRRGRVASHLSGGMDSTSVACLARDQLAGRGGRLAALSVVYETPGLAGERDYIRMALDRGGPVDPFELDGDSALDYDWFGDAIPDHDEPHPALFRLASERLLIDGARRSGAGAILTGAGADDLLVGDRHGLADLLRRGRWLAAASEASRWARADNVSPLAILARHALRPLIPDRLRDGPGPIFRRGYGRWPRPGQFTVTPWILPGFARRHDLRGRSLELARMAATGWGGPPSREFWLRTTAGDWSTWYLGAPAGVINTHPFLDARVFAFGSSLPATVKDIPGRPKAVLSEAMRGVLPEPIRTRRRKMHFNALYWQGLRRSLPALVDMVRGSRIADWGLFDPDALIAAIRQHAHGIGDAMAGGRINSSLALIAWGDRLHSGASRAADPGHATRERPAISCP